MTLATIQPPPTTDHAPIPGGADDGLAAVHDAELVAGVRGCLLGIEDCLGAAPPGTDRRDAARFIGRGQQLTAELARRLQGERHRPGPRMRAGPSGGFAGVEYLVQRRRTEGWTAQQICGELVALGKTTVTGLPWQRSNVCNLFGRLDGRRRPRRPL